MGQDGIDYDVMGWNGMGCWLLVLGSTGRNRVEMSASSTATWLKDG